MIFKKKPNRNVPFNKLTIDTTLTINTINWKIVEITRYDWSTDGHSLEYKLISTDGKGYEAFLEVERLASAYEFLFYEDVAIDGMLLLGATQSGNITYLDELFELDKTYKGSMKNETTRTEWTPVESYIFYDQNDAMLSIEKTDEAGCTAFYGFEIDNDTISNVVKPK